MIAVLVVVFVLLVSAVVLLFWFCFSMARETKQRHAETKMLLDEIRTMTAKNLADAISALRKDIDETAGKVDEIDDRVRRATETGNKALAKASVAEVKTKIEQTLRERLAKRRSVSDGAAMPGWRQ